MVSKGDTEELPALSMSYIHLDLQRLPDVDVVLIGIPWGSRVVIKPLTNGGLIVEPQRGLSLKDLENWILAKQRHAIQFHVPHVIRWQVGRTGHFMGVDAARHAGIVIRCLTEWPHAVIDKLRDLAPSEWPALVERMLTIKDAR